MSSLKPIKKLVHKAKAIHERHRERHRPSGFGFALADSIHYLDAAHWDVATQASSVYLSRSYLRVLESAGPENLRQRYALIFQGRELVAAVAAQVVTINAAKLPKSKAAQTVTKPLERLEERMLVCGNLLSWGMHGVSFAEGVNRADVWPAVAEALYRIRRADRLFGDTDLVMLKDVPPAHATDIDAMKRFSYRELETEPNMVLTIAPAWKSYEDYLASLTSNYRKTARKITKDVEAGGGRVERLTTDEIINNGAVIHDLYCKVHERQKLRLITLSQDFIPSLAATFGDDFRCNVIRRDDQTLGFVTTLKDGDTAVGYYIGFDSAANAEMPIYFRLLQAVIEDAIALGCTRLSLGRTALEPKARLGAKPEPMSVWIRHRIQAMNLVVRGLLQTVSHEEAPERNPFK
ncbi:MAG TPA: GNAT family N-acetyltransferase [Blastocatellia bacterium]|nr:GNAT family N-acetyltransferase [Blastocatellia bacterium]